MVDRQRGLIGEIAPTRRFGSLVLEFLPLPYTVRRGSRRRPQARLRCTRCPHEYSADFDGAAWTWRLVITSPGPVNDRNVGPLHPPASSDKPTTSGAGG